ncbi:hypothetical protein [Roseivivax sediminis]|uniref:Uncharacterized protein n=1 Tax=Roseivivax sediminis TaxID=936889 RepID=A0A1I2D9D1_9RHOB|nr:hypothetical protein [Roseivivax sediminis]SFE77104.1 hypothetical protein SAMN04515678_11617 [Roseivivax sediminis]
MMSGISGGGAPQVPQMQTGVLDRQAEFNQEAQAAAEAARRELDAQIQAMDGQGAASNAYRMAQILGAPPEQLQMLKSG